MVCSVGRRVQEIAREVGFSKDFVEEISSLSEEAIGAKATKLSRIKTLKASRILAEDESWKVRCAVARNTNTPKKILAQLAEDEDLNVRRSVARNTNTPKKIIAQLAEDENWVVRYGVTRNTNTPKEILVQLAEDENWMVRRAAQRRLNSFSEAM